jgi:hypothetical protein
VPAHRLVLACLPVLLLTPRPGLTANPFPALDGDFAAVCQSAFERSHQPDTPPVSVPLPLFDPPQTGAKEDPGLVFEEYNRIEPRQFVYQDRFLWAKARPRGNVHREPIDLRFAPGMARPYSAGAYRLSDFDYGSPDIEPPLPTRIPAAARFITALNLGARRGAAPTWPQFAYLGGSGYVRLTGLDTGFGTSLRLSAYNVGDVEAKPRLTELYLRPLPYHRFAALGVIESAPFTACMQTVMSADLSTRMQTTLRFYPRAGYVGPVGALVSPIAMSSMFWKGEAQTPADPGDEAHDADTMTVCGQAAAPLQGLVPAVGARPVFRDFGPAPCFGLMQLDRTPSHYQTYDAADYARRVSLWVGDLQSDLAFSVKLMTYGSNYEGEDNVVAYAEFLDELPVPLAADDAATFSYTITASALPPPQPGPRIGLGGAVPGAITGAAVALGGETLAVGAPVILGRPGSAYLFSRTPDGLVAERRLTPDDGVPGDHFGSAMAMSGDTLAVSAPANGAVYVFVRRGQDWVQQARITIPMTYSFWTPGYPVAIAGDTLVVGLPGDDDRAGGRATDYGAVLVYRRQGEDWTREALLRAPDREPWDHFGEALAIDGDTLAVGAPGDDYPGAWEQGSVYLFRRDDGDWTQTAKLTEPGGWKDYGAAVALAGPRLLVGVPRAHGQGWRTAAGAVCAYARGADGWSRQQCLWPTDRQNGDQFGAAVSLAGRAALIGAPQARQGRGAAYVYRYARGTWNQGAELTGDPGFGGQFGAVLATDGDTALIGAPPAAGREETVPGQIYVFPPAVPGTRPAQGGAP